VGLFVVVFSDFLVFEQLLNRLVAVAADIAHAYAMVFGDAMQFLN
jgi:hypothetical protein